MPIRDTGYTSGQFSIVTGGIQLEGEKSLFNSREDAKPIGTLSGNEDTISVLSELTKEACDGQESRSGPFRLRRL